MGKPRLMGLNNAYIPNSKADMHFNRNTYQRSVDKARRFEDLSADRREQRQLQELEQMKREACCGHG